MSVTLRPVPPGQRATLAPLLQAYAAEMRGLLAGTATADGASIAALLAADARTEILGAFQGDAAVGFALFYDLPEAVFARRCGQLDDLFVSPAARGQGIARALLGALAEAGRERGWTHLRWFVPEGDRAAIALYERVAERTDWRGYIVRIDRAASL
jgi:ribosomal protein S18 acetylase RimI-like enzyme